MDIPPRDAVKNIPLIVLGIWPANLLTLWARDHDWAWDTTPEAIIGLWQWGLLISLSLTILVELGVDMFIALGKYKRWKEQQLREREQARKEAREEGLREGIREGHREGHREARRETRDMLTVLNAAARTNPDSLPALLQEYQNQYQNGSSAHD